MLTKCKRLNTLSKKLMEKINMLKMTKDDKGAYDIDNINYSPLSQCFSLQRGKKFTQIDLSGQAGGEVPGKIIVTDEAAFFAGWSPSTCERLKRLKDLFTYPNHFFVTLLASDAKCFAVIHNRQTKSSLAFCLNNQEYYLFNKEGHKEDIKEPALKEAAFNQISATPTPKTESPERPRRNNSAFKVDSAKERLTVALNHLFTKIEKERWEKIWDEFNNASEGEKLNDSNKNEFLDCLRYYVQDTSEEIYLDCIELSTEVFLKCAPDKAYQENILTLLKSEKEKLERKGLNLMTGIEEIRQKIKKNYPNHPTKDVDALLAPYLPKPAKSEEIRTVSLQFKSSQQTDTDVELLSTESPKAIWRKRAEEAAEAEAKAEEEAKSRSRSQSSSSSSSSSKSSSR